MSVETVPVIEIRGRPHCSACRRQVQHMRQWRCPWTNCRRWFRDPDEEA